VKSTVPLMMPALPVKVAGQFVHEGQLCAKSKEGNNTVKQSQQEETTPKRNSAEGAGIVAESLAGRDNCIDEGGNSAHVTNSFTH
jgi:hypothetical protein